MDLTYKKDTKIFGTFLTYAYLCNRRLIDLYKI